MAYIKANGIVLNIEVRGRGEPVVLISDIIDDLSSWTFQTCCFGSLHFLMRLDNRGSGWSDCPESCTVEDMAQDVVCLMDLVGIDKAHLVGLGLGGMIAQELALRRPGRVSGLVLASTSARATMEQQTVLGSLIEAATGEADLCSLSEAMLPWLHSHWFVENDRWRRFVIEAHAGGFRNAAWDGARRQLEGMLRFDSSGRLGGIRSPTLIVSGSEDLLTPPPCAEELAAGIVGANSITLNAGHQLQYELPRSFNQLVLEFLARVEGNPIPILGPGMPLPSGFISQI